MDESNEVLLWFTLATTVTTLVTALIGILQGIGVIRSSKDHPLARRTAWIVGGVLLLVVGVASGVVWWRATHVPYVLSVRIVDKPSQPDRLLSSEQFEGITGRRLSHGTVEEVVGWIGSEIDQRIERQEPTPLNVRVPADPGEEAIRVTPAGPYTLSYELQRGRMQGLLVGGKPVPETLRENFTLKLDAPGYETLTIPVVWGQAQDGNHTLLPVRIRIAIEGFGCEDEDASQEDRMLVSALEARMNKDPRFSVYHYEDYEATLAEIGKNPIQQASSESWELDLVIVGDFERV